MLSVKTLVIHSKQGKKLASVENVSFKPKTISLIVGKNGSGKTSFLHGLFLHPSTVSEERNIFLDEENVSDVDTLGLYARGTHYVPQHLIPLHGVSFISFLHSAYEAKLAKKTPLLAFVEYVKKVCKEYSLPEYLVDKNVHENLSGGERKMQELIQVVVLKPAYLFLDEIDAGLDLDAKRVVTSVLNHLKNEGMAVVLVSHSFEFACGLAIDAVYRIEDGVIVQSGGIELLNTIKSDGFV